MADKNFARSGTADTDLLADDDPLSELARLVGYEPRPVTDAARSYSEPLDGVPRRENPVLALEDELMRAFEQYDAPGRVAVEPVFEEPVTVAARHEPSFAEEVYVPAAAVEDRVPLAGGGKAGAPAATQTGTGHLVDDLGRAALLDTV